MAQEVSNEDRLPPEIEQLHYDNWIEQDIISHLQRHDNSIPTTEVLGLCSVKGQLGKRYHDKLLDMTETRGDRRYLKERTQDPELMH